jgi:hypothetical protein
MPAPHPPIMTTSHSLCCAETVNSAISLWTELEVMDDDDEDLYTYQTLDTASAAAAQQQQLYQQQHQLYQDHRRSTQQQSAMRGCLRAPTILPTSSDVEQDGHEPMMMTHVVVDPKVQWQEEAYWMSFQSAVRSFSDHQEARASSSSSYSTSGAVPSSAARRMGTSSAERVVIHRNVEEKNDDDTDMSSFQYFHPHVATTASHNDNCEDEGEDDGIPPCIPRTVVTPTASLGSHSMKVAGSRHFHSSGNGHGHNGGSISIATSSSNSSSASARALPTFAAHARSLQRQSEPQQQPPQPPATTSSSSPDRRGDDGQFGEIRRSLRELMAQAAMNKKQQQQEQQQHACPSSPMSTTTAHTTAGGGVPVALRRGDPGYIISTSLAGPTLEEIKGLRWRMKELAEHAAVVARGHRDAEKYVIGLASSSANNNSSTL